MSFPKWQTLVVEDEADVRQELIDALNESPEFVVTGSADSLSEGVNLVQHQPSDVLFLDIKLIGGTAFDLLNHLKASGTPIPPVVINTGFREFEYAQKLLNEFGSEVVFILRKPFWEGWVLHKDAIIEAIYARNQEQRLAKAPLLRKGLMNIQYNSHSHLVNLDDVLKVNTGKKGKGKTEVVFERHKLDCNLSLSQLLGKLPRDFIQINRFDAINIAWISMVDQSERQVHLRNGMVFDIGDPFYKDLMKALTE
ncbi:MAG: response regulator [Haliscomenobacter sp.]|nr:response regulator [Haliscomenobacter sp.]